MKCLKPSIRILYINDDEDDALLFKATMADAGFEDVITFVPKEGGEVLDHLTGLLPDLPDVVVLDSKLPGMERDEVWRKICANEALNHLPVVLVTGSEGYVDMIKERCPDLQLDRVLIKPVSIESLTQALQPFSKCVEAIQG